MRWDRIGVVARKELLDVLRDRRTLISMIVVPVLLFPILMIVLPDLIVSLAKEEADRVGSVAIVGVDLEHPLAKAVAADERLETVIDDAPMDALREGEVQVVLTIPEGFDDALEGATPAEVEVSFDSTALRSKVASGRVQLSVATYGAQVIVGRLDARGIDPTLLTPVGVAAVDRSSEAARSARMVATFLPYLLILLCMLGALYPAVDLTAGEKERGTLETLLVCPLGRMELVAGKFVTVFLASLTTALLTCLSLWVTFAVAGERAAKVFGASGDAFTISPLSALLLLALLAPVACSFAALLLAMSTFARSYKEAMSYASPLMIVIIIPAMLSTVPGIEASVGLALLPIAGPSLLMADVLKGEIAPLLLLVTIGASTVYALGCMWLSAWLFTREQVLMRS